MVSDQKDMMDKKTEKKRKKLIERIAQMEGELSTSLGKKDSRTAEIDVAGQMRKIAEAKAELSRM